MSTHKYNSQDIEHAFMSATGETWATVYKITGLKPGEVTADPLLGGPVIAWLLERRENPKASLKQFWAMPTTELQEYLDIDPEEVEITTEDDLPNS